MFKKIALALVLCLAFSSVSLAAGGKIGVFNAQRISQESEVGKDAQKKFESQFGAENTQLEKQAQDLQKKFNDYQAQEAALSQTAKEDKQVDLMRQRRDLDEKVANFAGRAEKVQATLLQDVGNTLVQACNTIGAKDGFDLILDSSVGGVAFAGKDVDITNKVITEMNNIWKTRAKK